MSDVDHKMEIKSEEVEEAIGVGTVTHAPSEAMSNRIKRTVSTEIRNLKSGESTEPCGTTV
jgi:hypothetical protein